MTELGVDEVDGTLYAIGWTCAFVLPLIGLVVGAICLIRGPRREGSWMVLTSVVAGVAMLAVIRNA